MDKILLLKQDREITLNKFPTTEEINLLKSTYPNLRKIVFQSCIIEDFSLLSAFSEYSLCFDNCKILDQSIPIKLNGTSLIFIETIVDFQKLFYMTDMPNITEISLLYDSLEGIQLFKPYIHLLSFFPSIERIRIWKSVPDETTYYDLNHERIYEKENGGSNLDLLFASKLVENLDFIYYMPKYQFAAFDGIATIMTDSIDFEKLHSIRRKIWIDPKYLDYYSGLSKHELRKVQEELTKISKLPLSYREKLGREYRDFDYSNIPSLYPDLLSEIKSSLRMRKLNSFTQIEGEEPELSSLYGLFGYRLYNTRGHQILVNHLGNIIYDCSEDSKTKKLENHMLPF